MDTSELALLLKSITGKYFKLVSLTKSYHNIREELATIIGIDVHEFDELLYKLDFDDPTSIKDFIKEVVEFLHNAGRIE